MQREEPAHHVKYGGGDTAGSIVTGATQTGHTLLAQLVDALASDARVCGFESHREYQCEPVVDGYLSTFQLDPGFTPISVYDNLFAGSLQWSTVRGRRVTAMNAQGLPLLPSGSN